MRSRLALLGLLGLLMSVVFVVVAAGPATADSAIRPSRVRMPWTVTVTRDAPVYADTPDGLRCHFFGQCRPDATRQEGDPPPIAEVRAHEQVELQCVFGAYGLVNTVDESVIGFMPREDFDERFHVGEPDICGADQWQRWWE